MSVLLTTVIFKYFCACMYPWNDCLIFVTFIRCWNKLTVSTVAVLLILLLFMQKVFSSAEWRGRHVRINANVQSDICQLKLPFSAIFHIYQDFFSRLLSVGFLLVHFNLLPSGWKGSVLASCAEVLGIDPRVAVHFIFALLFVVQTGVDLHFPDILINLN